MDILTDAVVWIIQKVAQITLSFGRWASNTFIELLDWTSRSTVSGLRFLADLVEWIIENPWKALQNFAVVVVIVVLILMIEIYVYDLIKRRQAPAAR